MGEQGKHLKPKKGSPTRPTSEAIYHFPTLIDVLFTLELHLWINIGTADVYKTEGRGGEMSKSKHQGKTPKH